MDVSTGNKGVDQLVVKFFRMCGIPLLLFSIVIALLCAAGCLDRPAQLHQAPAVSLDQPKDLPFQMDFDSEISSDLFCVRGNIMPPGNSSLAYVLLNATLCQGSKAQFYTKYLLMDLQPGKDNSFEIAKNVKIPAGEYVCILEAVGPQGLLANESRMVSLAPEEKTVFELIPWPEDLDPDNRVSGREDDQDHALEEMPAQNKLSEEASADKDSRAAASENGQPADGAASLQASSSSQKEGGELVGSITSKKYHRPDCRYALKIKPDNRIYFQSGEDARKQGYLPCKVCSP
jgi:hypothetical protein